MQTAWNPRTRRPSLGREITLALVLKLAALMLLWALFFRTPPVSHPDARTTAAHRLSGHTGNSTVQGTAHV